MLPELFTQEDLDRSLEFKVLGNLPPSCFLPSVLGHQTGCFLDILFQAPPENELTQSTTVLRLACCPLAGGKRENPNVSWCSLFIYFACLSLLLGCRLLEYIATKMMPIISYIY